jgi:hypothetical protein
VGNVFQCWVFFFFEKKKKQGKFAIKKKFFRPNNFWQNGKTHHKNSNKKIIDQGTTRSQAS